MDEMDLWREKDPDDEEREHKGSEGEEPEEESY